MARQLGQILVDMGFINDDQLEMLVEEQSQQPGVKIGKVAEDMGLIIDTQLVQALAEQFDMQIVDLGEIQVQQEILDEVTEAMAQMYRVIPLQLNGNT
ncbi:MAG: pilus assembly protein PilB, partial [Planctomycetaceae bacterium]|nr:pilus assembly protein PilB [Planctomycetaceae bacterium]